MQRGFLSVPFSEARQLWDLLHRPYDRCQELPRLRQCVSPDQRRVRRRRLSVPERPPRRMRLHAGDVRLARLRSGALWNLLECLRIGGVLFEWLVPVPRERPRPLPRFGIGGGRMRRPVVGPEELRHLRNRLSSRCNLRLRRLHVPNRSLGALRPLEWGTRGLLRRVRLLRQLVPDLALERSRPELLRLRRPQSTHREPGHRGGTGVCPDRNGRCRPELPELRLQQQRRCLGGLVLLGQPVLGPRALFTGATDFLQTSCPLPGLSSVFPWD